MGFLKGTTNQIILDAVLTDTGRQFLARNDGSFSIRKFSLGDDEIDYSNITKYGQAVGNEKIIKNTPVAEAVTNQNFSLKHRLVSLSNSDIKYMPYLELDSQNQIINLSIAATATNLPRTTEVAVKQRLNDQSPNANIDVELQDSTYTVMMNNEFLTCNGRLQFIDAYNQATYMFNGRTYGTNGATQIALAVTAKSISSTMFDLYGDGNQITTYVKVKGMRSGATKDIKVTIDIC